MTLYTKTHRRIDEFHISSHLSYELFSAVRSTQEYFRSSLVMPVTASPVASLEHLLCKTINCSQLKGRDRWLTDLMEPLLTEEKVVFA